MGSPEMADLAHAYAIAVRDDIRWLQANTTYDPREWLRMVEQHGAVEAAKRVVNSQAIQYGLWHLVEIGHPERSVEYRILTEDRWHPLFDDHDREMARRKLSALGMPI